MKPTAQNLLEATLQDLHSLEGGLRRSYELCLPVVNKSSLQPEDDDTIETLTSRYARTMTAWSAKCSGPLMRLSWKPVEVCWMSCCVLRNAG